MKELEKKIIYFDCEVFAEDWLIVFHTHVSEEWFVFHNDPKALQQFISEHQDAVLCGYNVKHYDFYILKGCLLGYDPFIIKEINDFIIADGEQGWRYPFDWLDIDIPPMLDLMLDIVPPKSLKEIEGNLGLDITETTVDFDKQEKWTKKEFVEVEYYCKEDVKALRPLYEVRKEYIQAKIKLAEMVDLDPLKVLSLTNAKVTAEFLKAQGHYKPDKNEEYAFPKNLNQKIIPEDILNFFMTMESKFLPDGSVNEDASSTYEVDIADCPHKLGFGGLHGALLNYQEEMTDDRLILNYDVTSYYPSLMIQCGYISRATEHPKRFEDAYNLRVEAKKNGDKATSDALKLVLNTTFGASNNQYNKLYDPLMAKSICVSGQCFLIDLILNLKKIPSFRLIQSNTDGIMFSVDKAQYDMVKFAIGRWEKRTKFSMEEERISKIWQRDVNNYIMVTTSGKVKSKGAVFASYNNAKGNKFRGNSMSIIGEAITKLFTDNTPIETTINNCQDIEKFQIIARAGGSYDACIQETKDGMELVQKCNRVFAVKTGGNGVIKKVKLTDTRYGGKEKVKKVKKQPTDRYLKLHPEMSFSHEEDGVFVYKIAPLPYQTYPFKRGKYILRMDTVANCPRNCQIDNNNNQISIDNIDKEWYIKYANKEVSKMKGE